MVRDEYFYLLDLFRADGGAAGQVAVTPDWTPAQEWVQFEGIRSGQMPAVTLAAPATVEPLWHATAGEPYISAVRLAISSDNGVLARDLPTSYFRTLATKASARRLTISQPAG